MDPFVSSFVVGSCSVFSYLFLGFLTSLGKLSPFVGFQTNLHRRARRLSGRHSRTGFVLGVVLGVCLLALIYVKVRLAVMGIDIIGSIGLILILNLIFRWKPLRSMDRFAQRCSKL